MKEVTIVMYHYVRELSLTRYPEIKGLRTSEFKNQLTYLKENYTLVTVEECLDAIFNDQQKFPDNAALLTFDDGYTEHFTEVFPILHEYDIQGAFFPPAQAILEHKVLDVNKIHFVLASAPDPAKLPEQIHSLISDLSKDYDLEKPAYYMEKLAGEDHRYDSWEIVYVKRLLQRELPKEPKMVILNKLFADYVGVDEDVFAKELYMSVDQIKCMQREGMFIGGHGYAHEWLNTLDEGAQEQEITKTKDFLKQIGVDEDKLVLCYPYGAYDESLISIMKQHGFKAGLTTEVSKAKLSAKNRFTLGRFDTNDFPKE